MADRRHPISASITTIVVALATTPTCALTVYCPEGRVEGIRTEFIGEAGLLAETTDVRGFEVDNDGINLNETVYEFDKPRAKEVTITYGSKQLVAPILNEYRTYKSVAYEFGGVSFLDTIYLNTGKLFSAEHKDWLGANVATTWRRDCEVKP